jgi:hypothetical protein
MIGNMGLHLQEKLLVSRFISGVRLDPYRLKPVPVETPSECYAGHYVASWQVYLGDGSNALIVMEDISKTLY